MIFEDISQNSGNKATKESQIQKILSISKQKRRKSLRLFNIFLMDFAD